MKEDDTEGGAPLDAAPAAAESGGRTPEELLNALGRRLRESEARYRALFDRDDEGFAIVDMIWDAAGRAADYRFLEVNRAFERESGMRDVVGRTLRECVPEVGAVWIERIGGVAASGEPVRYVEQAMTTGKWFEVQAFRFDETLPNRVARSSTRAKRSSAAGLRRSCGSRWPTAGSRTRAGACARTARASGPTW